MNSSILGVLPPFNDKSGLVIDAVLFTNLLQVLVLLNRMFQNRITNPLRRLVFVLADHPFNLEPVLLVASVVNSVCVKEEDLQNENILRDVSHRSA